MNSQNMNPFGKTVSLSPAGHWRRDQAGEGMPMVFASLGASLIVGVLLYFVAGPSAARRATETAPQLSAEEALAQQTFIAASEAFFQLSPAQRDEKVAMVVASVRDSLQVKEYMQGLEELDALLVWTNSPTLRELRVDVLHGAGRLNESLLELKRLLSLRPDDGPLHFVASNMARTLEGVGASIPLLESAARLSPGNTWYQLTLAKAYVEAADITLRRDDDRQRAGAVSAGLRQGRHRPVSGPRLAGGPHAGAFLGFGNESRRFVWKPISAAVWRAN